MCICIKINHFEYIHHPSSMFIILSPTTGLSCSPKNASASQHDVELWDHPKKRVCLSFQTWEYCWWFRNPANQLRLVVYPIVYKVLYIQTVVVWDFWCINNRIPPPEIFEGWKPKRISQLKRRNIWKKNTNFWVQNVSFSFQLEQLRFQNHGPPGEAICCWWIPACSPMNSESSPDGNRCFLEVMRYLLHPKSWILHVLINTLVWYHLKS